MPWMRNNNNNVGFFFILIMIIMKIEHTIPGKTSFITIAVYGKRGRAESLLCL